MDLLLRISLPMSGLQFVDYSKKDCFCWAYTSVLWINGFIIGVSIGVALQIVIDVPKG